MLGYWNMAFSKAAITVKPLIVLFFQKENSATSNECIQNYSTML